MANLTEFTVANFEAEVLKSSEPVLVDFWATWCGPCRQLAPVLEELAAENTGISIGKLDIDQNQALAMKYNVTNIPTMLIFKNGEVIENIQGFQRKSRIQESLDAAKG